MKLLIPTYGRYGTITTPAVLSPTLNAFGNLFEIRIACHTQEEYERILIAQPELETFLCVSDVPTGPTGANAQRAWLAEHFLHEREWAVFADDNIRGLTGVRPDLYPNDELATSSRAVAWELGAKNWHEIYGHPYGGAEFYAIAQAMIREANIRDYWLCGFATNTSPMFRSRHYRDVGFVKSKLMLWKHDPTFPWSDMVHIDDYNYSAESHLRHGGVWINHWLYPVASHYTQGGLGSYDKRLPHRQESVKILTERYPGLLRAKHRPGFPENTELAFRLHNRRQIQQWQAEMLQTSPIRLQMV